MLLPPPAVWSCVLSWTVHDVVRRRLRRSRPCSPGSRHRCRTRRCRCSAGSWRRRLRPARCHSGCRLPGPARCRRQKRRQSCSRRRRSASGRCSGWFRCCWRRLPPCSASFDWLTSPVLESPWHPHPPGGGAGVEVVDVSQIAHGRLTALLLLVAAVPVAGSRPRVTCPPLTFSCSVQASASAFWSVGLTFAPIWCCSASSPEASPVLLPLLPAWVWSLTWPVWLLVFESPPPFRRRCSGSFRCTAEVGWGVGVGHSRAATQREREDAQDEHQSRFHVFLLLELTPGVAPGRPLASRVSASRATRAESRTPTASKWPQAGGTGWTSRAATRTGPSGPPGNL